MLDFPWNMSIKEIGVFLILAALIVLLSDGFLMTYSIVTNELEAPEVLAAIIGSMFLNIGVFFLIKHDLTQQNIR
jgi:uncharacterized membrane-anchored protein YitT (DUF2179 family)